MKAVLRKWGLSMGTVWALLLPAGLNAQIREPAAFSGKELIVPGALAGSGLAIHYFAHEAWDRAIRDYAQERMAGRTAVPFDDYVQFLPAVIDMGLGLTGAAAQHGLGDRCLEAVLANLIYRCIAWPSKQLFHTLRPNGEDYKSFPSGHAGTVFAGAELMRHEYGWGWGAGAYAVAGTVGVMRIARDEHWMSDVLCGAGIGILAARIAMYLLEPVKNLFGLSSASSLLSSSRLVFLPALDPAGRGCGAVVALTF